MSFVGSSSDEDSYYTIQVDSRDGILRSYMMSNQIITYPWNGYYYQYMMMGIGIYGIILSSILSICLFHENKYKSMDNDVLKLAKFWSLLQIFLLVVTQPIIIYNVFCKFEEFNFYFKTFYSVNLLFVILTVIFWVLKRNVSHIQELCITWLMVSFLSVIGPVVNKCFQDKIKMFFGY